MQQKKIQYWHNYLCRSHFIISPPSNNLFIKTVSFIHSEYFKLPSLSKNIQKIKKKNFIKSRETFHCQKSNVAPKYTYYPYSRANKQTKKKLFHVTSSSLTAAAAAAAHFHLLIKLYYAHSFTFFFFFLPPCCQIIRPLWLCHKYNNNNNKINGDIFSLKIHRRNKQKKKRIKIIIIITKKKKKEVPDRLRFAGPRFPFRIVGERASERERESKSLSTFNDPDPG